MYNVPEIKFSKKYQWWYGMMSEKDMNAWHKKLRAAVREHNQKMDKHND